MPGRGSRRITVRVSRYSPFAFCACFVSRVISSAVRPFVVRRSAASSIGWRLIRPVISVDTRFALASKSSTSQSMMAAIFRTLSSAGGSNSSRSHLDRYVGLTPIIFAISRSPRSFACRSRRINAPNFYLTAISYLCRRQLVRFKPTVVSCKALNNHQTSILAWAGSCISWINSSRLRKSGCGARRMVR